MTPSTRIASGGFTLLEILIAFTIATTALGLLFRIHGDSTATVILSEDYQEATALAQAVIAEFSTTERNLTFLKNGSAGKYEWSVRAVRYTGGVGEAAETPPYRLRHITVEVNWPARDHDRQISVRTIKPFYEPKP